MAYWREPQPDLGPGLKRAQPAAYGAPRAIAASAQLLNLHSRTEAEETRQRNSIAALWQNQAWGAYGSIGEVSYAFNYAASVLSRVRMHAAVLVSPDSAPIEVTDAVQITTDEFGSREGTPNGIDPRLAQRAIRYMTQLGQRGAMAPMLKSFALNIQVVGECYLCCIDGAWSVRSTSEIRYDGSGRARLFPSSTQISVSPRYLTASTPIGRIWNQHPRFSADPDSSLRAVLSDCEELVLLSRLMRVAARSRLNAGILFIPDTLSAAARTMGSTNPDDDSEIDEDLDAFEQELFDSLTAPVAQEDNAAAVVPMVVRGPAEEIKAVNYIQMGRDVSAELAARSSAVLLRVIQGINSPKELTTGIGSSRYSNAQLIDEQSYKALVEPLALTFADAVTAIYLTPLLRADAEINEWNIPDIDEQISRIVCWYDPAEVVTSVDQSTAANNGWDRKALSDSAWRKANGFSDNDAPTEKELGRRLVMSQVALPPDVQESLIKALFPSVFDKVQKANEQANGVGLPPDLQQMLSGTSQVAPSPPVPATSVPREVSNT